MNEAGRAAAEKSENNAYEAGRAAVGKGRTSCPGMMTGAHKCPGNAVPVPTWGASSAGAGVVRARAPALAPRSARPLWQPQRANAPRQRGGTNAHPRATPHPRNNIRVVLRGGVRWSPAGTRTTSRAGDQRVPAGDQLTPPRTRNEAVCTRAREVRPKECLLFRD